MANERFGYCATVAVELLLVLPMPMIGLSSGSAIEKTTTGAAFAMVTLPILTCGCNAPNVAGDVLGVTMIGCTPVGGCIGGVPGGGAGAAGGGLSSSLPPHPASTRAVAAIRPANAARVNLVVMAISD